MSKREYSTQSGPTYEELSKVYTDEEIVDAFVLPSSRPPEERAEVRRKLREEINKRDGDETPEEKIQKSLRSMYVQQLVYLKEDKPYDPRFSFPNQLKRYIQLTNNNQTSFGLAIGLEKTRVSKLVNGKVHPTISILHRLAFHGGDIITAKQWLQLHQRDQIQVMTPDHPEALQAAQHVTPAVRPTKNMAVSKNLKSAAPNQHKGLPLTSNSPSQNTSKAKGASPYHNIIKTDAAKPSNQTNAAPKPTKSTVRSKKT